MNSLVIALLILLLIVVVAGVGYLVKLIRDLKSQLDLTNNILTLTEENEDLKSLNQEYDRFLKNVTQVLDDDIEFLKGTLAQKLSLDIPEVKDLFRGLTRFQDDIGAIKSILSQVEQAKDE